MNPVLRFRLVSALAFALALLTAKGASAQIVEAGHRGSFVFDDLSGFRASTIGGVGYAGPLGVSVQAVNESDIDAPAGNSTTYHYTTFWFAPSIDYFVINHLSVGGLIEVAVVSTSVDQYNAPVNVTTSTSLPTTTDVTLLPRIGWLFDVTNRFGIWPRLGIGWEEHHTATPGSNTSDNLQSAVFDVDCGFLYRVSSDWFIRAAPEFMVGPGSHSVVNGNTTTSAGATVVSFAFAGGFGYMWNR